MVRMWVLDTVDNQSQGAWMPQLHQQDYVAGTEDLTDDMSPFLDGVTAENAERRLPVPRRMVWCGPLGNDYSRAPFSGRAQRIRHAHSWLVPTRATLHGRKKKPVTDRRGIDSKRRKQ